MNVRKTGSSNHIFLVTNYDQTAFTIMGTHINMLSYPLINFTYGNDCDDEDTVSAFSERDFDGFYGFSDRCVELLPIIRDNLHKKLEQMKKQGLAASYSHESLARNLPTYKITDNFEKATGLHCLGVSTPEDLLLNFGEGYEQKIKPWEQKGLRKEDRPTDAIPLDVLNKKYPEQRVYRLTEIAKHAAKNYPQTSITLTFINNDMAQCNEAMTAPNKGKYSHLWPENVSLEVYHHHAVENHSPIKFVGSVIKIKDDKPASKTGLQSGSMFASSQHAMLTRGKAATLATNDDAKRMKR